ncbi:MAG: glycosyltransferase family 4 protein [Candidatus Omnitrophota bacterium]|nr:glycosyltransferase family 4 protein [Candidatus Omnitrophota bacterium]
MNITFISHSYLPNIGGVELSIKNLCRQFLNKGHKINIITELNPRNLKSHEVIDGIVVDRFLFPSFRLLRDNFFLIVYLILSASFFILRLWEIMRKNNSRIINIHNVGPNGYYILLLSYFYRFRLIVTLHGFNKQILPFLPKKRSWIFNKILKRADYITSCSQNLLDDAKRCVPEIKDKSTIIPNGVNPEMFKSKDKYHHPRPYIFSLGRLQSIQKGFDILLISFREILDRGYDIDLIIAGQGNHFKELKHFAGLLKMDERVFIIESKNRKEVINFFNSCEFFVLPSRIEPFGIVNLEAMAAGKAIVATDAGGVPEIVKDGINGVLVKPKDDKSLAQGMMRLLDNAEFRNRLGENGRRMVKDYSWERIADRYLEVYRKVLNDRHNRRNL